MRNLVMFGRGANGVGSPEITDGERRSADAIKFGIVKEVDYAKARARVIIGDEEDPDGHLHTGWLPFGSLRARGDREWHPPESGERVVVLSESGEVQNGVVIPLGLYSDEDPPPGDRAGLWRKTFADGGKIEYDRATGGFVVEGKSDVTLKVGGVTLKVSASGVEITGGTVKHNGKSIGDDHKHTQVQSGGAVSGPPQ